ncbi:MAG TPA: DUF2007 domain-containing protein [Cyclobacteriaceae bacterium]|nr:DUF2007 domain-containing protein [Cyclobacteriaceae bacterium]
MRYITLTTVDDIYQAQFLSKALADEDIQCMEANENINTILPHLRQGIQIRVKETDYLRANVICERVAAMQVLRCPSCESNNVTYTGSELKELTFVATALSLLLSVPIKKNLLIYRCSNCGNTFKVN